MLQRMNRILRDERGFTLLEMIVVIVLVAILGAVAIPLYADYSRQGKAAEANSILGALVTAADTYYQKDGTYANFDATTNEWLSITARAKYFGYSVSAAGSATGIGLKATGNGIDAGINSTDPDDLTATVSNSAATVWTASGDCTAP